MKEVKAYIRRNMIDHVIRALEQDGFTDMTLVDVKGLTAGLKPEDYHYSLELAEKYMNVVKLEIICRDQDAERVVGLIKTAAHTGRKGDGLIYVTPVEHAVRIYTEGEDSIDGF
ncbi:MAG: P-II family nitrogen regulator [Nitrospirota bacterium]